LSAVIAHVLPPCGEWWSDIHYLEILMIQILGLGKLQVNESKSINF
jgi:hypothetical protein